MQEFLVKIIIVDIGRPGEKAFSRLAFVWRGWSLPGLWVVAGRWIFEINLCLQQPEDFQVTFSKGVGSVLMGKSIAL